MKQRSKSVVVKSCTSNESGALNFPKRRCQHSTLLCKGLKLENIFNQDSSDFFLSEGIVFINISHHETFS